MNLVMTPSMSPSDYYFSIQGGAITSREVVVTRKEYWDANRCWQDTSGPTGPDALMESIQFERLVDSLYAVPPAYSSPAGLVALKTFLQTKGFTWNPEMSTKYGFEVHG
jgi:hypothetical protein